MSVNVPVNEKIKEKDINAKLQLYGIYSGESASKALSATASARSCKRRTSLFTDFCLFQPLPMARSHP